MDSESELVRELRIDRLLRALAQEGEEANRRFEQTLVANAEVQMFADELNTDDPIARNREGFFKAAVVNPWKQSPRRNDSDDEPSGEDGEPLEKRLGNSRRRESLKAWIAQQLAVGETIEDLVEHAAQHVIRKRQT